MSVVQLTIPVRDRVLLVPAKKMAVLNSWTLKLLLILFVLAAGVSRALADAALLMEEPYGEFGSFNPTGHSAVYLNHVCAESPVKLRTCRPDEYGVVISRYHRIGGFDWIAIPLVAYLYAVDQVGEIPVTADVKLESRLRRKCRRRYLLQIAPNASENWGDTPDASGSNSLGLRTIVRSTAFKLKLRSRKISILLLFLTRDGM
jgi:hypothetical protein